MDVFPAGDVIVDSCRFVCNPRIELVTSQNAHSFDHLGIFFPTPLKVDLTTVTLSDNHIEGQVQFLPQPGRVLVERNHILSLAGVGLALSPQRGDSVIRGNVIYAHVAIFFHNHFPPEQWQSFGSLHVVNNTLDSIGQSVEYYQHHSGPSESQPFPKTVRIANNVLRSQRKSGIQFRPMDRVADAKAKWRVGHNVYLATPETWDSGATGFERQPTDVVTTSQFQSINPKDAGYLRPADDSPLASAGAGGDLPTYVGALPPGSAPKDGDWLTRLQNWDRRNPSPKYLLASDIPQPQLLAEWLKNRKLRTVSQDGIAEFRSIGDALKNVQAGEVVKVLDRGPYRERLSQDLPADVGIVSDVGTLIELPSWERLNAWDEAKTKWYYKGSWLNCANGLRLSGLVFVARELEPDTFAAALVFLNARGEVVIERCRVIYPGMERKVRPRPDDPIQSFGVSGPTESNAQAQVFFIENELEGQIETHHHISTFVLQRNHLRSGKWPGLLLRHQYRTLVIQNNVIECTAADGISFQPPEPSTTAPCQLVLCNNTINAEFSPVVFSPFANDPDKVLPAETAIQIENNILSSRRGSGIAFPDKHPVATQARSWRIAHNVYLVRPQPPDNSIAVLEPRPSDSIEPTPFVSLDPKQAGYLRLPVASPLATKGAGGAGGDLPNYIGALPPGPEPKDGDWFSRLRLP